jgi:hypothetical protein
MRAKLTSRYKFTQPTFPSHEFQNLRMAIPIFIFATLSQHRFRCHASMLIMATNTSAAANASEISNPYSNAATQLRKDQLRKQQGQLLYAGSSQATNQVVAATMGIQSQRREGSIKKCRKRATAKKLLTKHSRKQYAINDGGVAFNSIEHCVVCKAQHLSVGVPTTRIPKRAHHKRCSKNLKHRGTSEMTVFVNQEAARNLAANRAAILNKTSTYQGFFAVGTNHRPTNRVTTTVRPSTVTASTGVSTTNAVLIADPTSLRRELDERMEKLESEGTDYRWLDDKKYPAAIGLLVDHICSLFQHKKPTNSANYATPETLAKQEANEKYRAFFPPGSMVFTFGMDMNDKNEPPSPHYHALEGQSIVHVDWKLAFPAVDLLCYNCKHSSDTKAHLVHDRTNFSKNKQLFPLWTNSGLPMWCVLMNYKCESCKTCYAANDGRLLSLLLPDVAAAYPVLPKYASGQFHLHTDVSDDVDLLMGTYANGMVFSSKLYRKLGVVYTRKLDTYFCRSPKRGFVSYDAFTGGVIPPSAASIRACFEEAENSKLTPYGFSNFDRYNREMQSVNVSEEEKVAYDWTFQTIKNYNLPGAKAVFTGNKGSTKEITTLGIVPTTAVSQISHMVLNSREMRKEFKPAVLYTDTCPHNEAFWKGIFGTYTLETKLGLFHLLHRIMDTLDPRCELYWKCVVQLRNAIYSYVPDDENALLQALKDGSFSKTGEKLTDTEIRDLLHSKRWKQRYSDFLRKIILPGNIQIQRLNSWIIDFKDAQDQSGKPVFTRNTEKVATEQLKKVQHTSDVPGLAMYQEIPPGPRSTHGLSKWKCDRPESSLELFHGLMANYGNSGMNKRLADTLILGGTAEFNCKMRWKAKINKRKLAGESVDIPGDFVDLPRFYDHSYLHYLNERAGSCGLTPIFDDVHPISENNGEVFLSTYFEEQLVRNQKWGQDKKTSMCLCPTCITYMSKNTQIGLFAPEENDDNDGNDNSNGMLNLSVVPPAPPFFMQPALSTAACFVPPIPLAELGAGWMPRPHDCCYKYGTGEFHCATYAEYLHRKKAGQQVLGKPPHDSSCPVRRNTLYY